MVFLSDNQVIKNCLGLQKTTIFVAKQLSIFPMENKEVLVNQVSTTF